jgi:hypothetical protein
MRRGLFYIILFLLLGSLKSISQEHSLFSKEKLFELIAESYADDAEEEIDLSDLLSELEDIMLNPLNINTATVSDLKRLHILTDKQVGAIIDYRNKTDQIYSIYELQVIEGISSQLAEYLALFITYEAPEKRTSEFSRHEINMRMQYVPEKASGFLLNTKDEVPFQGIEPKLLLRYKGEKAKRFDWGLTAENDAGEPFFSGNNKAGFDFYSGFVGFKGEKTIKRLLLGDFQVRTGQGLVFWSGYGGRKSSEAINIRFYGQGIKPYTSAAEYGFFRGVASQAEIGNFTILAFYSNRNADANVSEFGEFDKPLAVSSLQTSGYHRTASEIADKGTLNIQTAGTSVRYIHNQLSVGVNAGYQLFDLPLEPAPKLYNQYYFRGRENLNFSADFHQIFGRASLFGEAALSRSGGKAFIAGLEFTPVTELVLCLLYRNFEPNYHTIGGSAFSEFGLISNEKGFYIGISLSPFPKVSISSYLDLYESPWVKFTSLRPVKGADFALQASYSPIRKIDFYVRYKTEVKNENSFFASTIRDDAVEQTSRLRVNAEWKPLQTLTFRLRTEWSGVEKEDSLQKGWLMLADASTRLFSSKLSLTARFAWYNTDHYNSGIRAYESDMPLSFNIPVYYLKGMRYYLYLNYKITQHITCYLKLARTQLPGDTKSIGSGNTMVEGNKKSDIKFQVRIKF